MKILAVSDMVIDRLYSGNVAERFPDVKMILGCGDLPFEYLEFLVSAMNVPLLYVPGNHDPEFKENSRTNYAEGCELLDRCITRVNGLNIAGFGGSMRYRPCCENQYSQSQMYYRIIATIPRLVLHLARNGGKLDIIIAHSPPRYIHDDDDVAHTGFSAFRHLIHIFQPRFFLHGHTLAYKTNVVAPQTMMGKTAIINVNPYRVIDV